jgi:probable phosphoglycerate mutase
MRAALLIRHGAVVGDADRRFIGATDCPMSDEGEAQIRDLAERLSARFPITAIYCSDLERSRRTAELLAAGQKTPIHVRPALREIDLGEWDGALRSAIAQFLPQEYEQRGRDIAGYRPPGGESFSDLAARVLPCWRALNAYGEDGVVAVAGHCGVNRVILCDVLGMPLANLFRIGQRPGSLNVIEGRPDAQTVRLLDAVAL